MGIHRIQGFAYAASKVAEYPNMIIVVRNNELRAATVPNGTPNCHKLSSGSGLPPAREGCTETLEDPWFIEMLLPPDFACLIAADALAELRAFVEGIHNIGAPTLGSGGVRRLINILL